MICTGREVLALGTGDPFANAPARPGVVRFVSVLPKRPTLSPDLPMNLPKDGTWLLRILATEGRFVFGMYRRQMKAISYLGRIDSLFGVPATTRNWNTFTAIMKALKAR